MSNRFVAKLLPNSPLVQGVFDTHKNEFMMNPKYPAHNPKPYTFTNLTNLHRVITEANKAHAEEVAKAAHEQNHKAAQTKISAAKKPPMSAKATKASAAAHKELSTAEKRAAGLAKARQMKALKNAERKSQGQVAA